MDRDLEVRVNEMEAVLTKLAIIQEEQTKQTEKLIRTVDKFSALNVLVEQISTDIQDNKKELIKIQAELHMEKEKFGEKLSRVKENLQEDARNKFIKAVTAAVAIAVFFFGYLYKDIKSCISEGSEHTSTLSANQQHLKYITKRLDALELRVSKGIERKNYGNK